MKIAVYVTGVMTEVIEIRLKYWNTFLPCNVRRARFCCASRLSIRDVEVSWSHRLEFVGI